VPIIWIAFFLSGVAGLSYEVAWTRFLTDLFGASTPAISVTISIYFLGMALGSWLGGKQFQRSTRPLRDYALLEVGIGVSAALVPVCLEAVTDGLLNMPGSGGALWNLVISTAVLIAPTTLLGATFPAMAAVVRELRQGRDTTSGVGLFYGLNTLGAVAGTLLVAFLLLPGLGRLWTCVALVWVNLLVAALAGVLHLVHRRRQGDVEAVSGQQPVVKTAPSPSIPLRLASVVALASGVFSIGAEVLWIRALSLSFPTTLFVLALVLSAHLVGVGLGALAAGRLNRRGGPPRPALLASVYLAVPGACIITSQLVPLLLPISGALLRDGHVQSWAVYLAWVGGGSVLVLLPATLAMGAALPLLIGAAVPDQDRAPRTSGWLYGLNTLGGVVGSLATTFWLMPALGLAACLMLWEVGYMALALWLTLLPGQPRSARIAVAGALAATLVVLLSGNAPGMDPAADVEGRKRLFHQDAATSTVTVYQDEPGLRSLWSNNLYSLSDTSRPTVSMQRRIGAISTRQHPNPRRALLVGFATGTTLGGMARDKRLKSLECVELHERYFEIAHLFKGANLGVAKDPRVSLIRADGRHFLSRPGHGYDLIAMDLFAPRNPGVSALYSVEHFKAARRRLNKGGVLISWLPLWQLSPREVGVVIRSFQQTSPGAVGMVAADNPARPLMALVGRTGGEPPPGREALLKISSSALSSWAEGAPLNTLNHPFIEHSSPRTIFEAGFNQVNLAQQNLSRIQRLSRRR